jgi:hypothetical protein
MDMSPDAVVLLMLYIRSIEVCQAKIIRGELPGGGSDEELLNCILNELEAAFTGRS